MIAELQLFRGIPAEIHGIITVFFLFTDCGMSVHVTTTLRVLALRMEKRSADMESSCECI